MVANSIKNDPVAREKKNGKRKKKTSLGKKSRQGTH
jgi:hypothetical protein